MTEEERRVLGWTRRAVFENLANGLPVGRVMTALKLSQLEVEQAHVFVARKIREYLFLRRQPPCECDSIGALRRNRRRALAVLAKIGDLDLSTDLILSRITVQTIDHPEMVQGMSRRMAEAY